MLNDKLILTLVAFFMQTLVYLAVNSVISPYFCDTESVLY